MRNVHVPIEVEHDAEVTERRYTCVTIFTYHFSRLSYVHLQHSLTVEVIIQAIMAFQTFSRSHREIIRHYHADNGRFVDQKLFEAVANDNQTISFYAAYAHHQNQISEKRIRDLQDQSRKKVLLSVERWHKASSIHL